MWRNRGLQTLTVAAVALLLTGCAATPSLTSIQVSPTTELFGGPGLTAQFTAVGLCSQGTHPPMRKDITNLVTWKSNAVEVAKVNASGMATSAGFGSTAITATMNGFGGLVTGNATVTVCIIDPSTGQCASSQ